MVEFLKDCGISDGVINQLESIYVYENLYNLS